MSDTTTPAPTPEELAALYRDWRLAAADTQAAHEGVRQAEQRRQAEERRLAAAEKAFGLAALHGTAKEPGAWGRAGYFAVGGALLRVHEVSDGDRHEVQVTPQPVKRLDVAEAAS